MLKAHLALFSQPCCFCRCRILSPEGWKDKQSWLWAGKPLPHRDGRVKLSKFPQGGEKEKGNCMQCKFLLVFYTWIMGPPGVSFWVQRRMLSRLDIWSEHPQRAGAWISQETTFPPLTPMGCIQKLSISEAPAGRWEEKGEVGTSIQTFFYGCHCFLMKVISSLMNLCVEGLWIFSSFTDA